MSLSFFVWYLNSLIINICFKIYLSTKEMKMSNKNIKSEYFIKSEMKVDINVFTEMRDGVKLFSDVYAPAK